MMIELLLLALCVKHIVFNPTSLHLCGQINAATTLTSTSCRGNLGSKVRGAKQIRGREHCGMRGIAWGQNKPSRRSNL